METQDNIKPKPCQVGPILGVFLLSLFLYGGQSPPNDNNICVPVPSRAPPQYIPISLPENVTKIFPSHRLLAYTEGTNKNIEKLKSIKFSGVPVLFIPDLVVGGYKLVRPLAASAMAMSRGNGGKAGLDYFTVDTGSTWPYVSSGYALSRHVQFVTSCVTRVLELYTGTGNVVLVGHGMGGNIAKKVAMSLSSSASVQVIITIKTPRHGLLLDREMEEWYQSLHQEWKLRAKTKHVSLVNIYEDVPDPGADVASKAPVGGVWCTDLVSNINRALVTLVSGVTKHISLDRSMRNSVLMFNIVTGGVGRPHDIIENGQSVTFAKTGYWSDILKRQFSVHKGNVTCDHFTSIKMTDDGDQERMLVLDSNHLDPSWLYGCVTTQVVKNTRMCSLAETIGHSVQLPGHKGSRRVAMLDLRQIWEDHGYSHIVVHTPANNPPSQVNIDHFTPFEREVVFRVPSWIFAIFDHTVIDTTYPGSVFYKLSLEGIDQSWQRFAVTVHHLTCSAVPKLKGMVLANNGESVIFNSSDPEDQRMIVKKGQTVLQFFFSPECSYRVSVSLSIGDIIHNFASSFITTGIPSHCIAIFMMLTGTVLTKEIPESPITTLSSISPFLLVIPARILIYTLHLLSVNSDMIILDDIGVNFGAAPLISYLLGHGFAFVIAAIFWNLIKATGYILQRLATRVVIHNELSKYPPLFSVILIILSIMTSESISLLLGFIVYIFHISNLYKQYIQTEDYKLYHCVNIHVGLLLLWFSQLLLLSPSFGDWIQDGSRSDSANLLHTVCILASCSLLWQQDYKVVSLCNIDFSYKNVTFYLIFGLAICLIPFASISVHRASFAVSSVFILLTSLFLLDMDWSKSATEITTKELTDDIPAVKKRGTYKIITSYLETGEGEEGLDWELVMTEEGDSAILQFPYYICVSNRLATLPADFLRDLQAVGHLAAGFLCLVVSSLWEQPRKPRIEVTVATPDYDYLPDNHPLRKIHLHQSTEEATEEFSKLSGFAENIKKVAVAIFQFHYQFYHDLFTVGSIGFGFLFYLISSFPLDVFLYFTNKDTNRNENEKSLVDNLKTCITLVPAAFQGVIGMVTRAVECVNQMVKNFAEMNKDAKIKKSPSPSTSGKKSTTPPTTATTTILKKEFPRKPSLSSSSKDESKLPESIVEKKQLSKQQFNRKSEPTKPNTIESIPAKSIEAFKTEVKIQEEILKFGKDKAKELFDGPIVVSGPWIPEAKESIVPGYQEHKEKQLPVREFRQEYKSGIFEAKTEEKRHVETNFDAPLPTSSVFERESTEKGFEMRAKVKQNVDIHGSMFNIHAACEVEDEQIEELEKLRDVSPDPVNNEAFRHSDISLNDVDTKQKSSTSIASRPLGLYHGSHFASMLSEAPRESPDLTKKYSVKEEIKQLRQTVREELINVRAAEPDEAIASGVSGESGVDDEYERIHIMKFDREGDRKSRNDGIHRRKSVKSRRFSKSPPRPYSPNHPTKEVSSDEDIKSWEMIQKDDLDGDENSVKRNLSASSSGSFVHKSLRDSSSNIRRRNRSTTREERPKGDSKIRSSSLQPDHRSNEFCDQLAKRLSGEFGKSSMQDVQVKRRDSFLDISIPFDDSKSAASLESLMFFSKTISDTANTFQQTLNNTAEKFSRTLDQTAASLKKALSEKNLEHASTQEISETLLETADLLSKTSEILSQTAKISTTPTSVLQNKAEVSKPEDLKKSSIQIPNFYPEEEKKTDPEPPKSFKEKTEHVTKEDTNIKPFRLDTITSQSEVDLSDTDTEDILKYVPKQPQQQETKHQMYKDHQRSEARPTETYSPVDRKPMTSSSPIFSARPLRPRNISPETDKYYRLPFGRRNSTTTSSTAKDLFKEVAQSRQDNSEYENPITGIRYRTPSRTREPRCREESQSPERYQSRTRGREMTRATRAPAPNPLNRTQSAATIGRVNLDDAGESKIKQQVSTTRSASVTPSSVTPRPGSSLGAGSSSSSLYRTPSYRLLGGRLVDSMYSGTSWRDDSLASGVAADQAATLNILREPYLIKTKDGKKQTLAEYEKSLVEDYKRRSQLNLSS